MRCGVEASWVQLRLLGRRGHVGEPGPLQAADEPALLVHGDEHLAPGRGDIDWLHFANLVQARGLKPSVTFETCFDLRDALDTRQFLADHPDFCRALGLEPVA